MGQRGPAPKPPGAHAPGTARDKSAKSGPKSPPSTAADLDAPGTLGAVGLECWEWLCARLRETRLDARANRKDMERYCRLYERWVEAESMIEPGMSVVEESTRYGTKEVKSKWVDIASDLDSHLTRLGDRFGLTPSARGSMGGAKSPARDEDTDAAARFIKGRTG